MVEKALFSRFTKSEMQWAKRCYKIYRGLKYLERRKYHGGLYSKHLKGVAVFFAVKYKFIDWQYGIDQIG
jgi:hypothetical protein